MNPVIQAVSPWLALGRGLTRPWALLAALHYVTVRNGHGDVVWEGRYVTDADNAALAMTLRFERQDY